MTRASRQYAKAHPVDAVDPASLPVQLNLAHISVLTHTPMSTLYHHWLEMEKDGRLPPRLKGYKRPRWPRDETLEALKGRVAVTEPRRRPHGPSASAAVSDRFMRDNAP